MPVIRQEQQAEPEKLVRENPGQTQQEHDEAPDISDSFILQGSYDEETTSVCSEDNNPQENILLTPSTLTSFNTFNINIHVNIYPFPVASSVEPQMNSTPNTAKSWRLRLGGKSASSLANSKIRSNFPELN